MRVIVAIFAAFLALTSTAYASEINLKKPSLFGGSYDYALNGYDSVAYHTVGAPTKGSADHKSEYKGATWLFASAENKALFDANPEKYGPAYGGHCAWAAGQEQIAAGDPEIWAIVEGKLYLNYNTSIQKKWNKNIPGFIEKADAFWPNRDK